jgi:hypothetical protein
LSVIGYYQKGVMRLSVGDPKLFAYYLPAMAHKAFHHIGLFIKALTSFGLFIGTFPRSGLINRMPPGLQYNQQCSPMSLDFQSSGLSSTLAYRLRIPSSDYISMQGLLVHKQRVITVHGLSSDVTD